MRGSLIGPSIVKESATKESELTRPLVYAWILWLVRLFVVVDVVTVLPPLVGSWYGLLLCVAVVVAWRYGFVGQQTFPRRRRLGYVEAVLLFVAGVLFTLLAMSGNWYRIGWDVLFPCRLLFSGVEELTPAALAATQRVWGNIYSVCYSDGVMLLTSFQAFGNIYSIVGLWPWVLRGALLVVFTYAAYVPLTLIDWRVRMEIQAPGYSNAQPERYTPQSIGPTPDGLLPMSSGDAPPPVIESLAIPVAKEDNISDCDM